MLTRLSLSLRRLIKIESPWLWQLVVAVNAPLKATGRRILGPFGLMAPCNSCSFLFFRNSLRPGAVANVCKTVAVWS